jgi:hypothetical protein
VAPPNEINKEKTKMKSALERVRELNEVSKEYPAVVPFIGAILELEDKVRSLDQTKQDKPEIKNEAVSSQDITNGNLMTTMHKILTAAGNQRESVAINIYKFLRSLQ